MFDGVSRGNDEPRHVIYVVRKVKYEDINHGGTHDAVLTCDCQAEFNSE